MFFWMGQLDLGSVHVIMLGVPLSLKQPLTDNKGLAVQGQFLL